MYGTVPSNTAEPPSVQVTEFEGTQLLGHQTTSHSCQRVVFILLLTTILLTSLGAALYALFSVHPHAATPPIVFHEPKYCSNCTRTEVCVERKCQDRSQYLFSGQDRVFVFENRCPFTIWVAGTMDTSHPVRPEVTGWEMAPKTWSTISLPPNMESVRFWARTGCTWKNDTISVAGVNRDFQKFVCETGDCGNALNGYGVECKQGSGLPPATLVEFSLSIAGNDFYDLSNVDGYNVGLKVEPAGPYSSAHIVGDPKFDCGKAACVMDTKKCPIELQKTISSGHVVCLSICKALWDTEQREKHQVLQDLFEKRTDRGMMRDFLCCDCGEGTGLCEALGTSCSYGCSPFVDNYRDPRYSTRKCENINNTYLPNWPLASNGENYAAVFEKQCPQAYSWQFNDDQSTYQCHNADYQITFYVKE